MEDTALSKAAVDVANAQARYRMLSVQNVPSDGVKAVFAAAELELARHNMLNAQSEFNRLWTVGQ